MITFAFRKKIDHYRISSMKVTNFSETNSLL
ncbi:MAG: hypothetical protein PWQ38_1320, partial [Proteiniphilum sp.]|nr:hypothetical protein [Proteiniphilum sp.]